MSNTPEEDEQDIKLYEGWANRGNIHAMIKLGNLYSEGIGVGQDYKEAVEWYRKAAEGGNHEAMYNLGIYYGNGIGVKQDYKEAMKWIIKAADKSRKKKEIQKIIQSLLIRDPTLIKEIGILKNESCMNGYKFDKYISHGGYGVVYVACKDDNCEYVVKIQTADIKTYRKEVELIKIFNEKDVGPRLIKDWECELYGITFGFMVIEKWHGELKVGDKLTEELVKKIKNQLNIIWGLGYRHLDIKPSNILVKRNKQKEITAVTVTDFGLTKKTDLVIDKQQYYNYHFFMYLEKPFSPDWDSLSKHMDSALLDAIKKNKYKVPYRNTMRKKITSKSDGAAYDVFK